MAGAEGFPEPMIKDPAVERWAAMREQVHYYYRFNRAKIIPTLVLLVGIPFGIGYASIKGFELNERWLQRRRQEMLGRGPEA